MALGGTETVGEQMETPPSGDEKSEKVGNPFWSERAKEEAMVRSMRPRWTQWTRRWWAASGGR